MQYIQAFEDFVNESSQSFLALLRNAKKYDVAFPGDDSSKGWKLSLQGKSINDAAELYDLCYEYLENNNIAFKVATEKRMKDPHAEQSKKALTIYVPNHMDHLQVAEEIYTLTKSYKGWQNIKTPVGYEHYAGAVYYRNDRNEYGDYISIK
jgi:hypothetical protein